MHKIGDRVICIKSDARNEGKIAVVIGFIEPDELGRIIFANQLWVNGNTMIVQSLCGLINAVDEVNGIYPFGSVMPANPLRWVKLDDLPPEEIEAEKNLLLETVV